MTAHQKYYTILISLIIHLLVLIPLAIMNIDFYVPPLFSQHTPEIMLIEENNPTPPVAIQQKPIPIQPTKQLPQPPVPIQQKSEPEKKRIIHPIFKTAGSAALVPQQQEDPVESSSLLSEHELSKPLPVPPTQSPLPPQDQDISDEIFTDEKHTKIAEQQLPDINGTFITENSDTTPIIQKKSEKKLPHNNTTPSNQQSTPAPSVQSPSLTFEQLAQGFMQKTNNIPSQTIHAHALDVHTGRLGIPDVNQLRHERYLQKILHCIIHSYKLNRHKTPQIQQTKDLVIYLTINRDGSIHSLDLLQSSGHREIDSFVLFLFKDASSSFPPVPQFFNTDIYSIPPFTIPDPTAFQSAHGWAIRDSSV